MIVPKELGQPIGTISVVDQNDNIEKCEIGYCIGRPWCHHGYTSESLAAVIRFFFEEVGMNRIEAAHDTNNPNSGLVMKKCGMRFEGIARSAARNNQGICDISRYAILRSDRK
jgi:ribosomal-protein-alanine N-acetyltransferase